MKVLFLFILIIIVPVISFSQFTIMINDTFKLSTYGSSLFNCICYDDSFYYANVNVVQSNLDWGNKIVKFDKNFQIVDERSYIDTIWMNGNYPYNTIVANEKQLLICPQITISNPFEVYGKIIALNKHTLDTLWTRVIEHPDTAYVNLPNATIYSVLTSIKETPDKGYILTGNYNLQCSGADQRSFLLKIDSLGNVEWRRTYNEYYTFFDLEIAADSGYYVPSGLNGTNAIQLVKFDKNGNYQWRTRVMYNPMAGYPLDLTIYNTQYAIISSNYVYDYPNFYMGVNISKVDLNTKIIVWEKSFILYQTVKCVGLHQAMGVETLPDGSIIVNGTVIKYGTDYSAFILKLNANGDSLWTKTYRFKNSNLSQNQLNDLMICDDGGFLGVGFYSAQAGSPMSAWMFKTDPNGVVGWEETKPLAGLEAKVYPNPARDFVIIELPENRNQIASPKALNAELKLYNALGQLVLERQIAKGIKEIRIDLKELKQGIYFFEIVNDEVVVGNGKFVKE